MTSCGREAGIRGANIAIVAVKSRSSDAGTRRAGVGRRACISVIAGQRVVGLLTTKNAVTGVGRAGISIAAIRRRSPYTGSGTVACVIGCAGVGIVAGRGVGIMRAPGYRVTRIVRAWVGIVAIRRRAAHTRAAGTGIGGRTRIAIVTGSRVIHMLTAQRGMARVICTWISIVAVQWRASQARVADTSFASIAYIIVVAVSGKFTASGDGRSRCADATLAGFGAIANKSVGTRCTVRLLIGSANTRPVATVGIIAIRIDGVSTGGAGK